MGTTEEKLDYLEQTKKLIAAAIEAQGVNVSDEDTFRAYAALIATIGKLPDLTEDDEGKILQVIGGAWGIGAGISADATLKTAGAAADAKVTGERFGKIEGMIGEGFEVSSEVNHDMNLDIEADAPTKATHSWFLVKDEGVIALRLKKLAVRTVGEGTVRFALYNRTKVDDDALVLTLEKILGEVAADTETGTASLTIDGGYYTEAVSPVVVFSSDAPIIGDYTVGSLVMKEAIILTDIDFMSVTEGEQVTCPRGIIEPAVFSLYTMVYDNIKFQTVNEFANSAEDRLSVAEKQLADLLYEEVNITSFTSNISTVEIGSTVNDVTLSWKINKAPKSLSLDGVSQTPEAEGSVTLTGLGLTANKRWTLLARDERSAADTATASVSFVNGVYYGASAEGTLDSTFIRALSRKLIGSKLASFTANATAGKYIWYCLPKRYGTCTFTVGGFTGGFTLVDTVSFTNASGYTEDYYVYKSDNAGLGSTTVTVS